MNPLATAARAIFAQALARVDIHRAVLAHLHADATTLTLGPRTLPATALDRLLIVAIGKAAVPMHAASRKALAPARIPIQSIVISPSPEPSTPDTLHLPGRHPTPDARSLAAATSVLELLRTATPRTAVLFLLSGGASAMLERPLDPAITLPDLAAFHRSLVASGLSIAHMNTLRKHVSAVKGSRLAVAAAPALAQHTLLLSDVPAATPDTIGSGPSLPDPTTLADCRTLLPRLTLPDRITAFLARANAPETPKPSHPAFARATWTTILSSEDLAQAAAESARSLAFHTEIDNTPDDWDYREAARYLLARSVALALTHPRTCLISVGELSLALPPNPGEGGRNQHFALFSATELLRTNDQATILSAGSDGIDGHSLAAGAVCDHTTLPRATALGLSPVAALAAFNSAPLLARLGDQIVTGPTGNNLRDLRLILRSHP